MDIQRGAVDHRTRLPHALAALYAIAIVYASLQPFGDWIEPAPGTPFFLFATWPSRWLRYDFLLNIVAYAPFGFFLRSNFLCVRRYQPLTTRMSF